MILHIFALIFCLLLTPNSKSAELFCAAQAEEGASLLSDLCNSNDGHACFKLAEQKVDYGKTEEALSYAAKACKLGSLDGCSVAAAVEFALGNKVKSFGMFAECCDKGSGRCCNNLGALKERTSQISDARKAYDKGCRQDNFSACDNLAILEKGLGNTTDASVIREASCGKGDGRSCAQLADSFLQRGDLEAAEKHARKACDELKDWWGCMVMSNCLSKNKNAEGLNDYMKKACDLGGDSACNALLLTNNLSF